MQQRVVLHKLYCHWLLWIHHSLVITLLFKRQQKENAGETIAIQIYIRWLLIFSALLWNLYVT